MFGFPPSRYAVRAAPLGLVLSLLLLPLDAAAQRYYLINDGQRWSSGDGQPVQGLTRTPGSICRDGGTCYGLIFVRLGGYHYDLKLPKASLERRQVVLDPVEGQRLYRAAQRGYWRAMQQEH